MLPSNMKVVIAVIFLVIVNIISGEELKQLVDKAVNECKVETGASQDEIDNYINHVPEVTYRGKCFMACIHEKFHIQDKNGVFNPEATRATVRLFKGVSDEAFEQLNHITEICLEQVHEGEDKCEVAVSWIGCLMKESKIAGFPPFLADL